MLMMIAMRAQLRAKRAAQLRAKIAECGVRGWRVAIRLGWHPSTLSLVLHEKAPLTDEIAAKILRAIESEAASK